jgi:hypothetical protein
MRKRPEEGEPCSVPECERPRDRSGLLCAGHWAAVPTVLKLEVWHFAGTDRYWAAAEACSDAVRHIKLADKSPKAKAPSGPRAS